MNWKKKLQAVAPLLLILCIISTAAETTEEPDVIIEIASNNANDSIFDHGSEEHESRDEWIEEAERLIRAGDDHIEYDEHYRDVILMAGNSGTGKSTLVKLLTLDDDTTELESFWSGDRFSIRDKEGLISTANSTVVSKTIYPKLIINRKTHLAFYDLPGFGDTRGAPVEMANADFIKRVADRARRVQIVFVVNYSSLKSSGTRREFLSLLQSATDYIKNPRKYRAAIALIANKVPAHIPHEEIVPEIVRFLKNARNSLSEILVEGPEPLEKTRENRKQMQSLIQGLLSNKDGRRCRGGKNTGIGYFKVPDREGPLKDNPETIRAKNALIKTLTKDTKFVLKSSQDFGISISPSTRLFLVDSIREVQNSIAESSLLLSVRILDHFKSIQGDLFTKIFEYSRDFNLIQNELQVLYNDDDKIDLYDKTIEFFNVLVKGLNLTDFDEEVVDGVKKNLGHLRFLQSFVIEGVEKNPQKILNLWTRQLQIVMKEIDRSIFELGTEVNGVILSTVSVVAYKFRGLYTVRLNNLYDIISSDSLGSRSANKSAHVLEDLGKDAAILKLTIATLMEAGSLQEFLNETHSGFSQLSEWSKAGESSSEYAKLMEVPLHSDIPIVMRPYRESPFSHNLWIKPLQSLHAFLDEEQINLKGIIREMEQEKEIHPVGQNSVVDDEKSWESSESGEDEN